MVTRWFIAFNHCSPKTYLEARSSFFFERADLLNLFLGFHVNIGCMLGPDIFIGRLNLLQVTRLPKKSTSLPQPPRGILSADCLDHHLFEMAGHFMRWNLEMCRLLEQLGRVFYPELGPILIWERFRPRKTCGCKNGVPFSTCNIMWYTRIYIAADLMKSNALIYVLHRTSNLKGFMSFLKIRDEGKCRCPVNRARFINAQASISSINAGKVGSPKRPWFVDDLHAGSYW